MTIDVLIPVLGRPEKLKPVTASLLLSEREVRLEPVLILSPDERRVIRTARELVGDGNILVIDRARERGDYARKINAGARRSEADFVFLGAVDLKFHPGWAEAAIEVHRKRKVGVVGTNDLGNRRVMRGETSTHSLVARDYIPLGTFDDPSCLLHEGYDHNYVDEEFVLTAKSRQQWGFATASKVEHMHPFWGKAEGDPVYDLGFAEFREDGALFTRRRAILHRSRR